MSSNIRTTNSGIKEPFPTTYPNKYYTPQKKVNKENDPSQGNLHFSDYKPTQNDFNKYITKPGEKFKLSYMFNVHASDFKPTQNTYDSNRETVMIPMHDPVTQEPRMKRQGNPQDKISHTNMAGHA